MERGRREFLTAAAAFAAGTFTVGTAGATERPTVSLLNGHGVPEPWLGVIGDFYIDDYTHEIYGPKRKTGWGKPVSLRGPKGPAGNRGAAGVDGVSETGPPGATGPQGPRGYSVLHGDGPPAAGLGEDDDFYIDTGTTQLYGPREGGVWGSPVSLTGAANAGGVIDGGTL